MTSQDFLTRVTGRDLNLRASDADRERVAERLRRSHAEGRLDVDEFGQRLERCYAAKTFGELGELVRDLPRQDEADARPAAGWLASRRWGPPRLVAILIAIVVIAAAFGHHVFWLWIPFVFLALRMSWWRRGRAWTGARRAPGDWF